MFTVAYFCDIILMQETLSPTCAIAILIDTGVFQ